MKHKHLIALAIFAVLLSTLFLCYRTLNYLSSENGWGDSLFGKNEDGNYYAKSSKFLIDKSIIQTFEGVIISREDTVERGVKGFLLKMTPRFKPDGKIMEAFVPLNLGIVQTKNFQLIDMKESSQINEYTEISKLDKYLVPGNGLYTEIAYSADMNLTPIEFNNFVVVLNPW